jgi:glycosyltransferase involved in cell wall biosynthesis
LASAVAWAEAREPAAEILVVDDGSEDGTGELARRHGATVLRIAHGGKGAALRAGIGAASGEVVLLADMDQATPLTEAPILLSSLGEGADIVLGSRGWRRPGAPLARAAMSLGHGILRRILLGLPWRDTQCGFKALRRELALNILGRMVVYGPQVQPMAGPCVSSGFDVEFLLVAQQMGLRIREVPVVWRYEETRRVLGFRDSWRGAKDLLAIAAARRRGLYRMERPGIRV